MEFGNLLFLFGLLAAPLPVLLHLFYRRRKSKVKFSTLMFFQRREKFLSYRRRLLELLLLLLRVLAIVLLALALCRIYFKRFNFITGMSTGAILVVDDTMSMQARLESGMTAFDCARGKAEEVLGSLAGGDSAGVVFVSGQKGEELTADREKTAALLRRSKVTGAGGSLMAAVRAAAEKLRRAQGLNREIYVFSDFRGAADRQTLAEAAGRDIRVFALALRGSADNLALRPVVIDSAPKTVGRAVNIPFTVANHTGTQRQVDLALEIDGREVQRHSVTVESGAEASGVFVYVPEKGGWISGAVKMDDGGIALDNRAFFAFKVGGGVKVVLASDGGGRGQDPFVFLRSALDPLPGKAVNGFNTVIADSVAVDTAFLRDAQVTVLSLNSSSGSRLNTALSGWLRGGGVLLTLPPERDGGVYGALAGALTMKNPYLSGNGECELKGVAFNAPLAYLNELLQLDLVRWRRLAGLAASGNIKVMAESQGRALLTVQQNGRGRWLASGFGLRRENSNWPMLRSFPVALTALLNHLCGLATVPTILVCGPLHELASTSGEVGYSTTWGTAGQVKGDRGKVIFEEALWPGVIRLDGADVEALVVNVDPNESRLTGSVDPVVIVGRLATMLDPGADLMAQIRQFRQGAELSGLLLLLLLAVLTLEFVFGLNYSRAVVKEEVPASDLGGGPQS